jgi:hypothetical protein
MTAEGKGFVAVLSTNQRGPALTRKVESREGAFAMARRLLDEAEAKTWHLGEVVAVEVKQSDD